MKKRITLQEWNEISQYNHGAKWIRPFCTYYLICENGAFKREQRVALWFYLLVFIPFHIIQTFYCLWNTGLKNFEVVPISIATEYVGTAGAQYEKVKNIWERA